MKALFLNVICILTVLFWSSCKSTPDLTEGEIYTIVNQIIADDSLFIDHVYWNFETIQLTDEYKKEFTKEDIAFINRQNKLFKNLKIKPNKLKYYNLQSKKFIYITVTACNQDFISHISLPFISVDRKKVMIYLEKYSNFQMGGEGETNLYEKRNGHWVKTKEFDFWISENKQQNGEKQLTLTNVYGK